MIPVGTARKIRDGVVTLAFRRWDAPRVKVGGTQMTAAGVVRFDDVREVADLASLTDDDAVAAGHPDADTLRARLAPDAPRRPSPRGGRGGDRVWRVSLSWVGDDPRTSLRETVPRGAAMERLRADVAALDASRRSGLWTREILEWIEANPGVVSTELATLLGREVPPMKADIRRLKALGLTVSLRVGYELSPRGRAYLRTERRAEARARAEAVTDAVEGAGAYPPAT